MGMYNGEYNGIVHKSIKVVVSPGYFTEIFHQHEYDLGIFEFGILKEQN